MSNSIDGTVYVRYLVDDVPASADFYTTPLGFALNTAALRQILPDDPSGNPVELFQPAGA